MPHVRLEYSTNLKESVNPEELFSSCFPILVKTIGADLFRCQGRATACNHFHIGKGNNNEAFVYLEILIMEGRTKAQLDAMGSQILKTLEEYFQESLEWLNVQIAMRVVEIPTSHYFKIESRKF